MIQHMPTTPTTPLLAEPESWRDLLAILISNREARAHAVEVTGLTEVTLKRWAGKTKNTTKPRSYMLKPLLIAFPEHADLLTRLIVKEFPDFAPSDKPEFLLTGDAAGEDPPDHVALDIYEHVLAARATTPLAHLSWSVCNLVLHPALDALDPTRSGIGIWVSQCLSSEKDPRTVCCLREKVQFGTAPWKNDPYPALLLGRESLSGYAISKGQPAICQDVSENTTFLPIRQEEYEKSAAAFPILFGERIAGCLLVASTQVNYFTPMRISLIERYAHLLSLGFLDHEFFDQRDIHLREMPPTPIQQQHLTSFRQRVDEVMNSFEAQKEPKTIVDAEQIVWAQLAEEFSRLV